METWYDGQVCLGNLHLAIMLGSNGFCLFILRMLAGGLTTLLKELVGIGAIFATLRSC